jgi:hypothetical protein
MSSLIDFVDVAVEDRIPYAISRRTGEDFCIALKIADKDYKVSFSIAINRDHAVPDSSGICCFW